LVSQVAAVYRLREIEGHSIALYQTASSPPLAAPEVRVQMGKLSLAREE